jgi:hypothetical protein
MHDGKPFKPDDFISLYEKRNIPTKHPRFIPHLNKNRTHFVLQHDSDDNTKKGKRMLHHHHFNPTTTAPQP